MSSWEQAFNIVNYDRLIKILELPINLKVLYSTPKVMFDTHSTSKNILDLLVSHANFILSSKNPYNFYGVLFDGDQIMEHPDGTIIKRGKLCFQFLEENIKSISEEELKDIEDRLDICLNHKKMVDLIISKNQQKTFEPNIELIKKIFEKPIRIKSQLLLQSKALVASADLDKPEFDHIIVTKLVKFLVNCVTDLEREEISENYISNHDNTPFSSFVTNPVIRSNLSEKINIYEKTLDIAPFKRIEDNENGIIILRDFAKIDKIKFIRLSDIIRLFYTYDLYDSDNLVPPEVIEKMINQPDIVSMTKVYCNL